MRNKRGPITDEVDAALARQKGKNQPKQAPKLLKAADVLRDARKSGDPSAYLKARSADPVVREVYAKWRSTTRLKSQTWRDPDE